MRAVDHLRLEQLKVCYVGISAFKFTHLLDLVELKQHEWRIAIALCVDKSQHAVAFFPAVIARQPSVPRSAVSQPGFGDRDLPGTLWEEKESKKEEDGGNHLQAPWDAEGRCSVDVTAAVADVEHDQNTPGDGPLLGADHSSSLAGRRQF
jgi:hypothetical protein